MDLHKLVEKRLLFFSCLFVVRLQFCELGEMARERKPTSLSLPYVSHCHNVCCSSMVFTRLVVGERGETLRSNRQKPATQMTPIVQLCSSTSVQFYIVEIYCF